MVYKALVLVSVCFITLHTAPHATRICGLMSDDTKLVVKATLGMRH